MAQPHYVLLTGAGFSRNWGAWLADEVFEYLLGCGDLDDQTRDLLWRRQGRGGGFEAVLAELQGERRRTLESAIHGMLSDLDRLIQGARFEFQNDKQFLIANFLARFDAIFTLNFDLILERNYIGVGAELAEPRRWPASVVPGVRPTEPSAEDISQRFWSTQTVLDRARFEGDLGSDAQPYFKLHGSGNWTDPDRGYVLVIGGDKAGQIRQHPLLAWYAEEFAEHLLRQPCRLMVIGYSFGDEHVNDAIRTAAQKGQLKLFIVDPRGVEVLDRRNPAMQIQGPPDPIAVDLAPHVIGASRRPLAQIFGGDRIEHAKLIRFFSDRLR